MKRIFILFGSTGSLGSYALKYFTNKNYDHYYFVSRKKIDTEKLKPNSEVIIADDLTLEKNVEEVFSKIPQEKDSSYFLFDAIGGFFGGEKIWETEPEELQKIIGLNFISSFLIAKHFARKIISTNGGSICFTSAVSGMKNEKGKFAYGVSKNGLNYLVKSLAEEGSEINLRANCIAPSVIDTPENREWMKDKSKLISTQKICDEVSDIFEKHPEINGQIIVLQ